MKVLLTIGKLGTGEEFIQRAYKDFSRHCMDAQSNLKSTKQNFHELGDMFVRSNKLDTFCDETVQLTEKLKQQGNSRLSDLLINELGKMCLNRHHLEEAEKYLHLAIENCQRKKDGMHELARLNDLEKIYKESNNKKLLMSLLGRKKDCCKKIIKDYDEFSSNYDSISRPPASKAEIQTQLAFSYSDLAELIHKRRPYDAVKMYEKARDIYKELDHPREVAYLDKRISWLKRKLPPHIR